MLNIPVRSKLGAFYFFYYAIVGTFMPYWNLYLQHQGFSFQQIGWLSSIAIITRFFAPFIWGWIADKSGKRMCPSHLHPVSRGSGLVLLSAQPLSSAPLTTAPLWMPRSGISIRYSG